jgi:hypothetical protein
MNIRHDQVTIKKEVKVLQIKIQILRESSEQTVDECCDNNRP